MYYFQSWRWGKNINIHFFFSLFKSCKWQIHWVTFFPPLLFNERTLLWNQSWNFNIRYSGKSILWWTDRVKSLTLPSISLDTSVVYNSIDKFRPVLQHVEILRVQVVQWNDKLSVREISKFDTVRPPPPFSARPYIYGHKTSFPWKYCAAQLARNGFRETVKILRVAFVPLKKGKRKKNNQLESIHFVVS